jgi:hypothetical protein
MKTLVKGLLAALLYTGLAISAEDFPGAESTTIEDEFEKGFSKDKGMRDEDHRSVEADRLKMGGYLQAEWLAYQLENSKINDFVSSPLTLEMYLDAQMKNDVRAFFKGRLVHDSSVDEAVKSPITDLPQQQNISYLDEMKISFNTQHKVFWTVGRQKIKWGASQFWNPTDFINMAKRDFLKQEDLRLGISMIKAHVPWRASNFYLVGVNEAANESSQNGVAGRIEIPINTSEWTLSSYSRKGQKTKIGSDLSFAVKDFDVYLEGAQTDVGTDQSGSGGLSYEFKYNDDDTAVVGLEGFWQENGVSEKAQYLPAVAAGKFIPFHLATSYTAASLFMNKPGTWNDSNLLLYAIVNNDDHSQYYRLTWIYTGLSDLQWTVALGGRAGDTGSEMKLFNQTYDGWVQMRVLF